MEINTDFKKKKKTLCDKEGLETDEKIFFGNDLDVSEVAPQLLTHSFLMHPFSTP